MHAYFVDSCKNVGETLFNRMEQLNLFLKVSECFCEVTIISRHSSLFVSTGNTNWSLTKREPVLVRHNQRV